MTPSLRQVACAIAIACVLPTASASVLTFDDLPGTGSLVFTSNYNGFMFGNNAAGNPWFYTDIASDYSSPYSGSRYASVDPSTFAGDGSYQATLPISNATPFVFDGAYFSDSPAFDAPDRIAYQLFFGGNLVYTSDPSAALGLTPVFVASGYGGLVNSVVITGQQGFYAMDDFTYNAVPAVPEPATCGLMLAGLAGLGVLAKRRRQG